MSVCFTNPRHSSQMFALFLEMREMEELCDIKIETNVDEISAHRVVLAANSPHFRGVLKDCDNEDENYVLSEEHDSKVVSAIIDYFYTGRLEIEAILLSDVINTAMFFQASDIVERCEDHVVRQLSVENCLKFYRQAKEFDLKDLQRTVVRFVQLHFLELTKQESFLKCSADEICIFCSSNILNIEKEEDVYEALWKWYKHDEKKRTSQCEKVFSNVRFFQLHPEFMTERVIPELAKAEGVCKDEIKAVIISQKTKEKPTDLSKLTPRYPGQVIYMFGNKSPMIEKYDPVGVECVKEKRMMTSKKSSSDEEIFKAAVVVENQLYVVSSEKVAKFNSMTLLWEKVGKGENVRESCICVDKDCFYVIGGKEKAVEKNVRCFNTLSLSWSNLPDIMNSKRNAGCVADGGRIYVIGGFTPSEATSASSKTHRFSSRSNKWKELAALNTPRSHFNAILVHKIIYAIGGRNDKDGTLNTIEKFDLNSQKEEWVKFEPNMNRPRQEFGCAHYYGEIWCLGGRGENTIEKFDFITKTWQTVGKLGEVRYGMTCPIYPMF